MSSEIETSKIYGEIRNILAQARQNIARTVNTALVETYWQVGRHIVEYEQQGNAKATYGSDLIGELSRLLVPEFGKGFNATNLRYMRQFYIYFPIYHALRAKLTWTHYRTLPEGESQIFAAKYMTYLPTKEELKRLLQE